MGRRSKNKPDPPPESVNWQSYGPHEHQYWMHGGPWIAPDDIEPQPWQADWMAGVLKGEARKRHVRIQVTAARDDLERQRTRYLAIHDKGMDAIEARIVESWRQRVHTGSVKPTDPDPIAEQLASCYRSIRLSLGKIRTGEQLLDDLERGERPLLFWKS